MRFVIGRNRGEPTTEPAGRLGSFRALDGSDGAQLYFDCNSPHAVLIVGKRGYGKSYTLGVIAEELARTAGVAPVLLDPMGAFETVADSGTDVPVRLIPQPTVRPDALDGRSWCQLVGLSPEQGAGALLWQAAADTETVAGMREHVQGSSAPERERRAALNHIGLADSWGVFDADEGLDAAALASGELTVIDLSGLGTDPMNAVARAIADTLYQARVSETVTQLPWLLVDEAHAFFDGIAAPALERVLTRGRAPGVSSVYVTQRPTAVPDVAISQSDILVAHRLTSAADIAALEAIQPTYMSDSLADRLPTAPGEVLIIDDATETAHTAQIRERSTEHGGHSPTARGPAETDRSPENYQY